MDVCVRKGERKRKRERVCHRLSSGMGQWKVALFVCCVCLSVWDGLVGWMGWWMEWDGWMESLFSGSVFCSVGGVYFGHGGGGGRGGGRQR